MCFILFYYAHFLIRHLYMSICNKIDANEQFHIYNSTWSIVIQCNGLI